MNDYELIVDDCRSALARLPEASMHCVVTSPPYWGLRQYTGVPDSAWGGGAWRGQLGLELLHDCLAWARGTGLCGACYVCHLVEVFRAVWRVLRPDGTVWLVLGDSYAGSWKNQGRKPERGTQRPIHRPMIQSFNGHPAPESNAGRVPEGLKPKDRAMVPARVALALQADGWWIRSENVWSKPNPMPESVQDRPTDAHEMVYQLSRSACYYFDAEAIREPAAGQTDGASRNRRSVWTITTKPYKGSHFATMPLALAERCILAGTSERGGCAECGAPWRRRVEKTRSFESGSGRAGNLPVGKNGARLQGGGATLDVRLGPVLHTTTTGWNPGCSCGAEVVPCTVLDPFAGSGTTGEAALRLGRRAMLVEVSAEYAELIRARLAPIAAQLVLRLA